MTRSTNVIRYTKNPKNSKLSEKQLNSRCQHQKWQRHQKYPTQDFLDKLGNEWQHRKFWHRKSRYKEEPNGCFRPQIQKLPVGSLSHGTSGGWRGKQHEDKTQPELFCSYCSVTDKTTATQREGHSTRGPRHQEDGVALLGRH